MMDSGIKTIHHDLTSRKRSCYEIVQEKLSLLSANTFKTANLLLEESALTQAKQVDEKIRSGKPIGLLEGIPFGIQDVILLQNSITTCGSAFLKRYKAPYTATAIQKLIDAGAIPVVKEKCDNFGHGNAGGNTTVPNAKDTSDSSGCSAVNVAKGFTHFSIAADTGGSICKTAGSNRIWGLKPTYGRVSRYGMLANMSSTGCMGPLSSSLEDIRILINTMSGKDRNDPTTCSSPMIPENVFDAGYLHKGIVAGYYTNFLNYDYLDENIKNDFLQLMDTLSAKGITIKPLDFFDVKQLVAVFHILAMAEEASNLARFDGSLYGAIEKSSSHDECMKTCADMFSEETKRRIVGGNMTLSHGNFEEIYLKARALRNEIVDRLNACFKEADIILSPVNACGGTTVFYDSTGDVACNVSTNYIADAFTAGFSLGGLPTLTVPFFTPTGLQITSNKNQEDVILNFAHALNEIQ